MELNLPYSVQMRENTDQKNSEYGHILHSELDATVSGTKSPYLMRQLGILKGDGL